MQYVQFTDPFFFTHGPTRGPALQQRTQMCGSTAGCRTAGGMRRGTPVAMILAMFSRILLVVEISYNRVSKRRRQDNDFTMPARPVTPKATKSGSLLRILAGSAGGVVSTVSCCSWVFGSRFGNRGGGGDALSTRPPARLLRQGIPDPVDTLLKEDSEDVKQVMKLKLK